MVASLICLLGLSDPVKANPEGIELLLDGCLSFESEAEFCPAEIGLDCQLKIDPRNGNEFLECARSKSSNILESVFVSSIVSAEHGSQSPQANCEALGNEGLSTHFSTVGFVQGLLVRLCKVREKTEFPRLTGSNRRFDLKSASRFFQACVYLSGSRPLHLTACSGALGRSSVDDVLARLDSFLRTSDAFLTFEGFPQ